jgi:DNA-binding GntR family transcriptional regulator
MPLSATPLDRRQPIATQIHRILRERIVSLDWKPRLQLSRAEIADAFGVSQTPVREAMLKLEADGLIRVWPQSRTEVAPIDLDQVRETLFLRRALELEVALTVAARRPAADLAALQAIVDQQRTLAADDAGLARFMALDRDFHCALFQLAGQTALHGLLVERSADLDRVRRLHLPLRGKRLAILADHQAILDAIAQGDMLTVAAAVRQHLGGTAARLDALVAEYPAYF